MEKQKSKHEVYVVRDEHGVCLYVGSGLYGRHRHCSSGHSHVYELNKMHFENTPIIVEVVKTGLTKEKSLKEEQGLVNRLKPKFNKQTVIKEVDDVDFNDVKAVEKYLKRNTIDKHLSKLILLYTQETEIAKMVLNKMSKYRDRKKKDDR